MSLADNLCYNRFAAENDVIGIYGDGAVVYTLRDGGFMNDGTWKKWDSEPFEMPVWTLAKRYLEGSGGLGNAASESLLPYRPFPSASDRAAYETLPPELRAEVIHTGEQYLNYDYPVLRATDYMRFKRTGNRTAYEDVYFARRGALCSLAAAECMEHQGRFLDDLVNGIFVVCEESGWQLPPHNSYQRSEPQYLLPDATRPVLDLFACETGALLACVDYALGAELDAFDPVITRRIRSELQRRILTPYLTSHFWWMGGGTEEMCNWTAWCTQNVLLTAFLSDCGVAQRRSVIAQAAASCDYFLKDYGEDGCCDEGAEYFRHAGLCLGAALEIMDAVTGGAFAGLFHADKIRNLGSYIVNMHADGKYYFNFADCSAVAGRCSVREYLYGKRANLPALCAFAAEDYVAGGCRLFTDEVDACSLFHRLQTCFVREEVKTYAENCARNASAAELLPDVYYKSVGIFRANDASFCLAVKAGDNADSHNHNDTGSLILYKNGLPFLADIGVESYTQKTFSPQRYEIWTMQSGYHNLPTIAGTDQRDGRDFRAADVTVSLGADAPRISMELATAYPLTGISYRRNVTLDRARHCVTIEDITNCGDVILNFITYEKPEIKKEEMTQVSVCGDPAPLCLAVGTLGILTAEHCSLLAVETLPVTDPRLKRAWEHDLYRIRLRMGGGRALITLA